MSIYYLHDKSYCHYFFECPDDLTEKEDQTNRFYLDVRGGFNLGTHIEGSIPYINLYYIILLHASYVYVLENVSYKLLRDTLPHYTNLTDIRDISIFIYHRFLEDSGCGLHHTSPRYCLLAQGRKRLLLRKLLNFMNRHF